MGNFPSWWLFSFPPVEMAQAQRIRFRPVQSCGMATKELGGVGMNKALKELIDKRFYGKRKLRAVDVKVRMIDGSERVRRVRRERERKFGSRMRELLVGDGECGFSFQVWLKFLLFGVDRRR